MTIFVCFSFFSLIFNSAFEKNKNKKNTIWPTTESYGAAEFVFYCYENVVCSFWYTSICFLFSLFWHLLSYKIVYYFFPKFSFKHLSSTIYLLSKLHLKNMYNKILTRKLAKKKICFFLLVFCLFVSFLVFEHKVKSKEEVGNVRGKEDIFPLYRCEFWKHFRFFSIFCQNKILFTFWEQTRKKNTRNTKLKRNSDAKQTERENEVTNSYRISLYHNQKFMLQKPKLTKTQKKK